MKEDLVPIVWDENMIQEMPEEFNKVLGGAEIMEEVVSGILPLS